MRHSRLIGAMLAGLAGTMTLAACGETQTNDTRVVVGRDYQATVEAMEEGERNATFIRAIRDAGRPCQQVQSSARAGSVGDTPAWTATCENGVQYTLLIGLEGMAQVLTQAEVEATRQLHGGNNMQAQ